MYDMFVPRVQPKTSSVRLPYQCHNSSGDCASQSSSLHSKKNFLIGGCRFFVSDVINEVVFGPYWLMLPGLGPNR